MTDLHCRVYTDDTGWPDLAPAWQGLSDSHPKATPWQGPVFLRLWWQYLCRGERLRIHVVLRDETPVMILPLQLTRLRFFGRPITWLEPIGMPNDINRPRLALGTPDPQAYACALDAIWSSRNEWDGLRIDEKSTDDPELAVLHEFAAQRRLMFRQVPFDSCPSLNLRQSWSSYLEGRPTRFRKNLRAAMRRLEGLGTVRCELAETPEAIGHAYETMLEVQGRSWKHAARIGLSESAALQSFYRDLLHEMAERGMARVLVLKCNDQPVAATFALMDHDTYYSVEIAHDTEFDHCSPGTLLESLELQGLMSEGRYIRYDLLSGTLGNKLRWAETLQPTTMSFAIRPRLRTRLFSFYHFRATPLARRLGWKQSDAADDAED